MKNKGTLILSGLGLNCERETAHTCQISGASRVEVQHTLSLLKGEISLKDYDFLVFIGGFLDGDYLGSGRVGANRYKYGKNSEGLLKDQLSAFSQAGNLMLGICNGFQLMVKLGLLPFEELSTGGQSVSLTHNSSGIFEDRWVDLQVNPKSNNVFTKGLDKLYLPVRHGEGKMVVANDGVAKQIVDQGLNTLMYTDSAGTPTGEYPANPNGSWLHTAGLGNSQGNLLGLMPHPEAYHHFTNHPNWTRQGSDQPAPQGLQLFENAYRYLDQ